MQSIPNENDIRKTLEESLEAARDQISKIKDPNKKAMAELELSKAEVELKTLNPDGFQERVDEAMRYANNTDYSGIEGMPSKEEIRRLVDEAMKNMNSVGSADFDLSSVDIQKQMDEAMKQLDNLDLNGIEGMPSKEEIRRLVDEAMKKL